MDIFWRLILAHLLADFTFQTDFIAKWKRENILGGLTHSFIFFACGSALCFGGLGQPWSVAGKYLHVNGWVALAALSFMHFLEDEWRVWTVRRFVSTDSFLFFMLDQFIHIALIFVFFPPASMMRPEQWVLFGILLVLTTHFASIFVYFIEKTVKGAANLESDGKYYLMAERLAVSLALILPGFWALCFAAAWIPRLYVKRRSPGYGISSFHFIAGSMLAVFLGVIARLVFYS